MVGQRLDFVLFVAHFDECRYHGRFDETDDQPWPDPLGRYNRFHYRFLLDPIPET